MNRTLLNPKSAIKYGSEQRRRALCHRIEHLYTMFNELHNAMTQEYLDTTGIPWGNVDRVSPQIKLMVVNTYGNPEASARSIHDKLVKMSNFYVYENFSKIRQLRDVTERINRTVAEARGDR